MKKNTLIVFAVLMMVAQACEKNTQENLDSLIAQKQQIESQIAEMQANIPDSLKTKKTQNVKYVEVKEVKTRPFSHFIEVQGSVDSDQNIMVTSKSAGTVEAIPVTEGTRVAKGQLIARLDGEILNNSIKEVKSSLEFATEIYEKQKGLWDQKIGSEVQYLQAKNNKESLENRLATLYEQAKQSKVFAPISGTVDQVFIKQGEVAAPGVPVVRIVNLAEFEIKANVAENYALAVKKDIPVILYFPDLKAEVNATVNFVGNVIDPINRTFNIVIRFKNPNVGIKPNMIAVVKIEDYKSENEVVIPLNAIVKTNNEQFVFVAVEENGNMVAKKLKVKTAMDYNGVTVIKEGLKASDKLITFGFQDLVEGQLVKF